MLITTITKCDYISHSPCIQQRNKISHLRREVTYKNQSKVSNKVILSFIPWSFYSFIRSLCVSAGSVSNKISIINVFQS